MKYVIMCGGMGKRCNNYSLPKPLNYFNGKHMIEYVIESIPSDEIYIIYNLFLEQFNFEEIIINLFKEKKIFFSKIDYLTRGAVETAYSGLKKFNMEGESLLFLDNDNLHVFPNLNDVSKNFIGYGKDYHKTNYSFITIHNNNIINIEEKNKISDDYCCGIYGFSNVETFNKYAEQLFELNLKTKNEFYFSQLYKLLIKNKEKIFPILIEKTNHIGSYEEIINNKEGYSIKKLRICFDLDNTLVTYPTIPNDYSSVKPIQKNVELLNKLKNMGHEIIIYTARRMKTHNNNVGRVIKDIALITIQCLEKFDIPYDELIFGKPLADIYIDDRALNPYVNNISLFGIFNDNEEYIPNKIANNKYNSIKKSDNVVTKEGPQKFLKGEIYFYQNIPPSLQVYFPTLRNYEKIKEKIFISMDYVEGIPLFYLYKNKLITKKIIDDLFIILDKFHKSEIVVNINDENVKNNYFKKLENRFAIKNDYWFEDAQIVYNDIIKELNDNYNPKIVGIIHGDFWFSNIILDYADNYKCIDMKGQVDDILTLNGDLYYDYGKFYQSVLGYDLVLNNIDIDHEYTSFIEEYFLYKCKEIKLDTVFLKSVTKSLIFGTIHSISDYESKNRVWSFLKSI
jgi:capsule biosynthesis phosphatase